MNRREFLMTGGALAMTGCATPTVAESAVSPTSPKGALLISPPVLQNAAETSMGVAFAVSALANGFVRLSESPTMTPSRFVKCGGYRVTDMNDKFMLVRLTDLKPATRYYYTIGADRISYEHGYAMKRLGTEEDPCVYSFQTLGDFAMGHFCVINDTHGRSKPIELALNKIAQLEPSCVVWNGDACTTQETFDSFYPIFYKPGVGPADYAARTPYLFVPGNHDFRGRASRQLERVWMFRQPEERSSRDWDLGRNFAVRCGAVALIGLDTGEDKLDSRASFAGLFNMEPYRVAQTAWLKEALLRPEIQSAPYLVAFCHIPLYDSNPTAHPGDCEGTGEGRYSTDFSEWQRLCFKMWGPLLEQAHCQLVVAAHTHRYRVDEPNADHAWTQIVGGGPELGVSRRRVDGKTVFVPDAGRFPTVIEGKVEGSSLAVHVHDVLNNRLVRTFRFNPRG